MQCSGLRAGNMSGSSRGHGQAGSSVPERRCRVRSSKRTASSRLESRTQICLYIPSLLLSPALSFLIHPCWNYHNPLSGKTVTFSNRLVVSEEPCCRNMKPKISKLIFLSTSAYCCFPAPFLKFGMQLSPKIITSFPYPCQAPFLTPLISTMVLHSACK